MKITVTTIKENEDGSALVEFEADEEGKVVLMQEGLLSLLMKAVKERDDE